FAKQFRDGPRIEQRVAEVQAERRSEPRHVLFEDRAIEPEVVSQAFAVAGGKRRQVRREITWREPRQHERCRRDRQHENHGEQYATRAESDHVSARSCPATASSAITGARQWYQPPTGCAGAAPRGSG